MKVLLTDVLFPNKYAKWRLVEIKSFIDKYDTDILVPQRILKYGDITWDFDYEYLEEKFNLNNYNILIFDPKFNYINKYNKNFDGTLYNNKLKASYMLVKKGDCDYVLNFNIYDKIYHIFLDCYNQFNKIIKYPFKKQYIHLYPEGGVNIKRRKCLKSIKKEVNIVVAQHFLTSFLKKNQLNNNSINLYGCTYFYKNEFLKKKNYNNEYLNICFTSINNPIKKGFNIYTKLYEKMIKKKLKINFYTVGNCPKYKSIINLKQMAQDELSIFYNKNIDIYINLENDQNGFPLGIESVIDGCFLLTTDKYNSNKLNNFNFDDFIIINIKDLSSMIEKITILYHNRDLLKKKTNELQKRVYELFKYEKFMNSIFNFLEND